MFFSVRQKCCPIAEIIQKKKFYTNRILNSSLPDHKVLIIHRLNNFLMGFNSLQSTSLLPQYVLWAYCGAIFLSLVLIFPSLA